MEPQRLIPVTPSFSAAKRRAAETAIRDFLTAMGLNPDDPNLKETASRVVEAWNQRLLAGYKQDPSEILADLYPTQSQGAVVATRMPFMSMCPHHLLPLLGQAHIAFVPNGQVPGFGRLPKLLDAFANRLTLQEDLTQSIVDALKEHLDVAAAACVLEAQHSCVAVTDPARQCAVFRTTANWGPTEQVQSLMSQIDASLRDSWPRSTDDPDRT